MKQLTAIAPVLIMLLTDYGVETDVVAALSEPAATDIVSVEIVSSGNIFIGVVAAE